MKTAELRIGNFAIDIENGNLYKISSGLSIDNSELLCPIPITEEWLIKLGFSINEYNNYYINKTSFGVEIDSSKFMVFYGDSFADYTTRLIEIKYIHQLQNLYFALTGKELLLYTESVI